MVRRSSTRFAFGYPGSRRGPNILSALKSNTGVSLHGVYRRRTFWGLRPWRWSATARKLSALSSSDSAATSCRESVLSNSFNALRTRSRASLTSWGRMGFAPGVPIGGLVGLYNNHLICQNCCLLESGDVRVLDLGAMGCGRKGKIKAHTAFYDHFVETLYKRSVR